MEFRLLGPVELWIAGQDVDLGPVKQRTVLAGLLVEPGRLVPSSTLIDRVWGDSASADSRNILYTYIARLRRILAAATARGEGRIELLRQSGGYRLDVDPERIDLHRFQRLAGAGRAIDGLADGDRAGLLRAAVALCSGTPLAGLSGSWAARTREAIERQRLDLLVLQADVEMRLGRPEAVIDGLLAAFAENPLSETLLSRLLISLYRAGRGAEALECYAIARRRMLDAVGAEPGREVRRLHAAILRDTLPSNDIPTGGLNPPSSLPADLGDFTGRGGPMGELIRALSAAPRSAPAVAVVTGRGGLGKTALAVHVAHRLRGVFPDGQLYVDLRRQEPQRTPIPAADALERLLRVLGVSAIPAGLGERAELYRSLLADRRLLVVLDDAADEAQIEPLLPGAVGSGVLVTSRGLLAGLSCERIALDVLDPDGGIELLSRIIGAERVAAEPAGARELIRLCEGLPLALRLAGSRLVSRSHWTVAQLVSRLSDEDRRLDELSHGCRTLRASLDLSYQGLDRQAQELFTFLGPMAKQCFPASVDQLLSLTSIATEETLDRLVDAHLLDTETDRRTGQRIYRRSDLIRLYAKEHAAVVAAARPLVDCG